MSSGVTLSSATRSNLLALQNTADLVSTTQNRLSTGKKVNSAIDNASNYFTASGLSSRSSALSTLLDGISNGIQTIQAASQGITSIQKLTAQLKSTAQQALASSNSFTSKASSSSTLTGALAGNLLATGGTVATGANPIGSSSTAAAATATGSANYATNGVAGSVTGTTFSTPGGPGTLTINGGPTINFTASDTGATIRDAINAQTSTSGVTATFTAGVLALTSATGNITYNSSDANLGLGTGSTTTTNYAAASAQTLTVNGTAITIGATATLNDAINAINAQSSTTGVTAATGTGGAASKIVLTGPADGSTFKVQGSASNTLGFSSTAASVTGTFHPTGSTLASTLGFAANDTFTVNGATVAVGTTDTFDSLAAKVSTATNGAVTASFNASSRKFVFTAVDGATAVNLGDGTTATAKVASLGFVAKSYAAGLGTGNALNGLNGTNLTVKVGAGTTATQTTISFGTGASQVSTLDQLNAALGSANAQASIDANGKLTITTANEAGAEDLNLSGTATSSVLTGTSSSAVIGGDGSTTRNKLVSDYNNLLTQIDQLSSDAGFNGVNLLAGDTVKVIFNEKNSSSVSIKGIATTSDSLGLKALGNTDFQDGTKINSVLNQITSANTTLQSQAATYGTNLSVVQNRQDFSKGLINILDTGAANLTDADLNEEAANSQALTTRQSLGISALSLANQAQQGVLQLLR